MATDWWPEQNGRLSDGYTIMCIVGTGGVTENAAQKFATSTASQISVTDATALGGGWGIAMKTEATVGNAVPVFVFGMWKCTQDGSNSSAAQGTYARSGATPTLVSPASTTYGDYKMFGGGDYILGMYMQTVTAVSDNVAVFVGRTF